MADIRLFDYQEDMKERIEKALRLHQSVMAQMPTGTGKIYLLTAGIDSCVSNNPMDKVCEQVIEPGNYYDMKFLQGNSAF